MDVLIDISQVKLETPRLILRGWQEADLADFYEYASVPGVGECAGWYHHGSIEESARILNGWLERKNVFAITLRETGKVIGSLGMHRAWAEEDAQFAPLRMKEIGYVLGKPYWGQGLMTEAVKRAISYLLEDVGLDAVTIGHFEENARSRRVIEKCGFTYIRQGIYHSNQMNKDFADRKYLLFNPATMTEGMR